MGMFARVLLAAIVFTGCASPAVSPRGAASSSPSEEPSGNKRFDALELALEAGSEPVQTGSTFEVDLVVSNESEEKVVDPGCWLAATRSALVPPDDAEAELWHHVVVDCGGPYTIWPGDEERHSVTFVAASKYGDPLPPGDYVAAVELRGLSRRLETPVTVTD